MTLGTGTFVPSAKFAFPRPYVRGIWLSFNSDAVVLWADNAVAFLDPPSGVNGLITFAPNFWEWSSNRYSLDYLIVESWYRVPPSPTEIPLPFTLTFYTGEPTNEPYLVYNPFGSVGTGAFKHDMPTAPPGYWLPLRWD